MKALVHRGLGRIWRGEAGPVGRAAAWGLFPLELLWRLVTWWRNRRFDRSRPTAVAGIGVVSVGNLAVGGTGKTPVSSWIARALQAAGARPAIVLRGYGRDEAALHGQWTPAIPVLTGVDRIEVVGRAAAAGATVAVLDDGFQHRRLDRDLDLVLLAVEDRLPGPLLPRGPYREPVASLRRADGVVLTRRSATKADAEALAGQLGVLVPGVPILASVRLATSGLRQLGSGLPAATPEGGALVLTAVARPEAVRTSARACAEGTVELLAFADHHEFSVAELARARRAAGRSPIIVTEKDAVKLAEHAGVLGEVLVLEQELLWDWGEETLRRLLTAQVAGSAHAPESGGAG